MRDELALDIQNVSVTYHGRTALKGVTLKINQGDIIGIVGPNGAGKSTLLKAVLGLVPLESGRINVFGKPIDHVRARVAYVPQRETVDWDFPVSVYDVVLMGRYPHLATFQRPRHIDREIALRSMESVGIADLEHRQIGALSGGQRQRVFLARALAQQADMMLLDEPFVGVDAATETDILSILRDLRSQGKTVILVNHDLAKITEYVHQLVLLNQRLIAHGPTNEVFTPELLSKTYGGRLTLLDKTEAILSAR
jgi:manganese/zinc/iron transport system ATP- binding protein